MAGQESKSSRLGSQKVTGTHLVPVRHPVGLVVGYGGDLEVVLYSTCENCTCGTSGDLDISAAREK